MFFFSRIVCITLFYIFQQQLTKGYFIILVETKNKCLKCVFVIQMPHRSYAIVCACVYVQAAQICMHVPTAFAYVL